MTATRDLPSSRADQLKAELQRGGAKFEASEIASNHAFDDQRIKLETVVLDWLSHLQPPTSQETR